jgi:hypothetical protein
MAKHVQDRNLALFGESRPIPIFLLATLLISSVFYFLIIKIRPHGWWLGRLCCRIDVVSGPCCLAHV